MIPERGSLAQHPALLLVSDLVREGAAGRLRLVHGPERRELRLRDGALASAASTLQRHQPEEWLASLSAALRSRPAEAEEARLRDITLDALSWVEGEFEWTAGPVASTPPAGAPLLARSCLLEAARRAPEAVQTLLLNRLAHFARVPQAPALDLAPPEWSVLRLLDRTLTLEALTEAAGARVGRGIVPLLAALVAPGLVTGPARTDAGATSSAAAAQGTPAPAPETPEMAAVRATLEAFEASDRHDLYSLLGLTRTTDSAAIQKSYHALARTFHPDNARDADDLRPRLERYFAAVTEAYNTLSRPAERERYDALKAAGQRPAARDATDPKEIARQNFEAGRRHLAGGRLHDAAGFLANAVRLDGNRAEYHREFGIVQMQNPRGRQVAEAELRRAIQLAPTDERALVHLGLLLKRTGRLHESEAMFQEVLRWDPTNATAQRELSAPSPEPGGGLLRGLFGRRQA